MSVKYGASFCLFKAASVLVAICAPVYAQFIPASNRIDMALDSQRGVLYIGNGSELLRYHLSGQSFLPPIAVGGNLRGMDISPDGTTLAVADRDYFGTENFFHLVDLSTGSIETVSFTRAFGEAGTYSVAYGIDGRLLVSTEFAGSGWVPLRRYEPATGAVTVLASVRQRSMLAASADRSVIGYEESNGSNGPFGRYRVADGTILKGPGTGQFNAEIGVNRNGSQFAFPTAAGCFIFNGTLRPVTTLGVLLGPHPVGVVYHPTRDIVYFAWKTTTTVRAHDTSTFAVLDTYETGTYFGGPADWPFREGRLKITGDGSKLFCTVDLGVLVINLNNSAPVANGDSGTTNATQPLTTLTDAVTASVLDNDVDYDPGTTLTVTTHDTTSAMGAAVIVNGDGTFNYDPRASVALQALAAADSVVDTFGYTVSDGTDAGVGTVTITVYGYDAPPPMPALHGLGLVALMLALVFTARRRAPQCSPRWDHQ
jgi:VCBS repeat-containing protein